MFENNLSFFVFVFVKYHTVCVHTYNTKRKVSPFILLSGDEQNAHGLHPYHLGIHLLFLLLTFSSNHENTS